MKIVMILVSIATLLLCSSLGPVRAVTLLVSNQLQTHGNVPVYITCHGAGYRSELSKSVPLGQKTLIEVPGNATAAAAKKVWLPTMCIGTFYAKAHFTRHERPYVLYDSGKDYTKCKDVCYVLATDYGFYRWDEEKRNWEKIFPITWVA